MKMTNQITGVILVVLFLTGCDFIKNAFTYKDKVKALIETLLEEDYERALTHFAMEHEMAKNTDIETMKDGLADFRENLVDDFGTDLKYRFMKAEKRVSSNAGTSTPPNTTLAFIEFSNDEEFGIFEVLFDDASNKILTIIPLDIIEPVPSMTTFWLFGILVLCVLVFNIYIIRRIAKSDLKRKWLKYLSVIIFNVPTITYAAIDGLSVKLLNFQILLGASLNYMGYLNSAWAVGLPLGGLYWLWKFRQKNR